MKSEEYSVSLSSVVKEQGLTVLRASRDFDTVRVRTADVNRPALQLAGFFDHFDAERVQIIGYVEYTFLEQMDPETKRRVYETLLAYKIPCIIFCRDLKPDKELLEKALELDVDMVEFDINMTRDRVPVSGDFR